jgi:steroid 17alpha-monooxygenase/17alpha-hydroxyprogesterone aldolase
MGCNRAVVINNYRFAKEAMLKKGTDFAGRPPHFLGSLFSRNGKGVGFQTYTSTLKLQRKAITKAIKELEKESKLENIVCTEIRELISNIENTGNVSDGLRADLTFAISNIISCVIFGERFMEGDSEFMNLMDALTVFAEGLAATSFIDTFPFLRHIPFLIIEKVKKACTARDKILDKRYNDHKKLFENNCKQPSKDMTETLLQAAEDRKSLGCPEMSQDHIVMTMNDAIIAGSETPSSSLIWIIYYLIKYPDVQERLQRELDDVIGSNRPPKWAERQELPYLQAFLAEALRSSSVMPLGIPHQAMCDSTIGPYQVPKGTTVLLNIYAIHQDPEVWENPMDFNPDRFLDDHGCFSAERATGLVSFGLGHRSCPGEVLAKMEFFIFTSHLLQKFKFKRDEGHVLPETSDCSFGIVMRPAPFRVCVSARN